MDHVIWFCSQLLFPRWRMVFEPQPLSQHRKVLKKIAVSPSTLPWQLSQLHSLAVIMWYIGQQHNSLEMDLSAALEKTDHQECHRIPHHALLPASPQMALFATPELGLTPLICAHIKILRFLFRLRHLDTSSPSLCGSVLRHSPLQGCTTPPPRKTLATVYHWLYWEHLMAQSWWILWAVDLLITVPG